MPTTEQAGLCPRCNHRMDVKDSRGAGISNVLCRRHRVCPNCDYRCRTHEVIVKDNEGFANSDTRRAIEFIKKVQELAEEMYGEDLTGRKQPRAFRGEPDQ